MNNDSQCICFTVQQRNQQELDPAPTDGREGALEPPPDASYSNSQPLPSFQILAGSPESFWSGTESRGVTGLLRGCDSPAACQGTRALSAPLELQHFPKSFQTQITWTAHDSLSDLPGHSRANGCFAKILDEVEHQPGFCPKSKEPTHH